MIRMTEKEVLWKDLEAYADHPQYFEETLGSPEFQKQSTEKWAQFRELWKESESKIWLTMTLELMKGNNPFLPEDLQLVYIRGGAQEDGFVCIGAKFSEINSDIFYRIHLHLGYHEDMDQSKYPYIRIRNFTKKNDGIESNLVPSDILWEI